MLDLYLMRHAKSSWSGRELSDRERDLSSRGKKDAFRMGKVLSGRMQPISPNVSPALRAELTWAGICSSWPAFAILDCSLDEDLYTFSFVDLLNWLQRKEGDESIFIIGHNPALTELINYLAPADSIDNLPTAGFAHLSLSKKKWKEIERGVGRLQELLLPHEL